MESLFINVWKISLFCSVIILFIFLISPILRKGRTVFWRYLLWIALGIRLVLPFDFSVENPLITIPMVPIVEKENVKDTISFNHLEESMILEKDKFYGTEIFIEQEEIEIVNESNSSNENLEKNNESKDIDNFEQKQREEDIVQKLDFNFKSFFSFIWIFGCVVMTGFQVLSYCHFKEQLNKTKKYLFSREGILVYSSNLLSSPMLFGILKPEIFLPEREYTKEALEFVLSHELAHYKRKDLFVKLLLGMARTMHWFNPLVYKMEKQAEKDMELLCDSEVVEKLSKEEKKKYSEMLLIFATERKNSSMKVVCSSEFSEGAKTLKERFKNIFADEKRKKGISVAFIGVIAILAVSFFVAFGSSKIEVSNGENSNQENSNSIFDNKNNSENNNEVNNGKNQDTSKITQLNKALEEGYFNVLLIGEEGEKNADAIMLLTLNKKMERVVLTSFLRDIYVTIPEHGEGTLSESYKIGGSKLLKDTIEENFSVLIHGVICCDYESFEKAIDAIGGVELKLGAGEVELLNSEVYISKEENRNLEKGMQVLNGNQVVGYIKITSAQDLEGQKGDFARTSRQRRVLDAIYNKCSMISEEELQKAFQEMTSYVKIDMFFQQDSIVESNNGVLLENNGVFDDVFLEKIELAENINWLENTDWWLKEQKVLETFCVPMEGTYVEEVVKGKKVLRVEFDTIKEALKEELLDDGWDKKEYLFEIDGWQYYLEEDGEKESRLYDLGFDALNPILLVRYKDDKREIIEDLIIEDFTKDCPVLLMEKAGRIIYKAASVSDHIIGIKDPVLVSIALDGSDRRIADTMLYHHFENICEDNGWIYYSGWTNDRAYPRPLCRIAPDFVGGPQYVTDLPGILCAVHDNYAFYLASDGMEQAKIEKASFYKRNLATGEDIIHDKWGIYANEIAYFHAREKTYKAGELYEWETPGVNIRWAFQYGEEIHSYDFPLYTNH